MFRGKVIISKTDPRTWKVYQIEKEFTDPKEYEQFIKSNSVLSFWWFDVDFWPNLSLWEWINFEKWIEDFIWKRFGLTYPESWSYYSSESEELPVDLTKYEKEVKKIEQEKKKKEEKIKSLKNAIEKLKEFRKKFEEVWDKEKISQIDKDIKKVEAELKKLQSKK